MEAVKPSGVIDVDQATFCKLINAEVEHHVADGFKYSIPAAVEEAFMNVILQATENVASQKSSILNGFNGVLKSRLIRGGYLDFYLETWQRNLADTTMFQDSTIYWIMFQRRLITPVAQFVKNTVHNHA